MATGRHEFIEREKFNQWFHSTGVVLVVDPRTKSCNFGLGRWVRGELVEIDERLEQAALCGASKEDLMQLEKEEIRRKAHLDQQFAETEKLQAEIDRKRTPMPEAELLKRRKALEEFIEQRDKVLADNPPSSD